MEFEQDEMLPFNVASKQHVIQLQIGEGSVIIEKNHLLSSFLDLLETCPYFVIQLML